MKEIEGDYIIFSILQTLEFLEESKLGTVIRIVFIFICLVRMSYKR